MNFDGSGFRETFGLVMVTAGDVVSDIPVTDVFDPDGGFLSFASDLSIFFLSIESITSYFPWLFL